jgi:nucleotide-binding universal stress UspA family protein
VAGAPILICYDGSEGAQDAIATAATLLVERTAVVLNVGPLLTVVEDYTAFGSGVDAADLDRAVYEEALACAEAGAALAREAGFRADARGDVDTPTWRSVVEVADEIGAAAIVVGSRGLSGIRELVEGSVSHDIAENAGRPVLIVPTRS